MGLPISKCFCMLQEVYKLQSRTQIPDIDIISLNKSISVLVHTMNESTLSSRIIVSLVALERPAISIACAVCCVVIRWLNPRSFGRLTIVAQPVTLTADVHVSSMLSMTRMG